MGKRLIINGADFSTNGIDVSEDALLEIAAYPMERGSIDQTTGEDMTNDKQIRMVDVGINPSNSIVLLTLKSAYNTAGYQFCIYRQVQGHTGWRYGDTGYISINAGDYFRIKMQQYVNGSTVQIPLAGGETLGTYFDVTFL